MEGGASCITGDIGAGKSFVVNAMTHGLGTQYGLTAWQRGALRWTRIEVVINDEPLVIERRGSSPESLVRVTENGAVTTYRPAEWSVRALDMLGYTNAALSRATQGRRAPALPTLTHLLGSVLMLAQSVVDQPPDALYNEKQLATRIQALLDVTLRLDMGRVSEIEAERKRRADSRGEAKRKAARLHDVIKASRWARYSGDELRIVHAETQTEVRLLRATVDELDRDIARARFRQREAGEAYDRADERRTAANARVREIAARLEAIETELENLHRPRAHDRRTDCDACRRPLAGLPRAAGACELCGRADAPRPAAGPPPDERRRRLIAERDALRAEQREWQQRAAQWDAEARRQFDAFRREANEQERLSRKLREESVKLATETARLGSIEEVLAAHERRERHLAAAAAADDDVRRLDQAIRAERERVKESREKHVYLTPLYQSTLYTLNLSESHEIDRIDLKDHSFTFAGQPVSAHGAGGTASLARVARLITLILYAHRYPDASLLPGYACIDTPRKDYGNDRHSYSRSRGLFTALRGVQRAHTPERSLQLFVCDGSVSAATARGIHRISLDTPLTNWRPG